MNFLCLTRPLTANNEIKVKLCCTNFRDDYNLRIYKMLMLPSFTPMPCLKAFGLYSNDLFKVICSTVDSTNCIAEFAKKNSRLMCAATFIFVSTISCSNAAFSNPRVTFSKQLMLNNRQNQIRGQRLGGDFAVTGSGLSSVYLPSLNAAGTFTGSNGAE
jgi:hypothetical protein